MTIESKRNWIQQIKMFWNLHHSNFGKKSFCDLEKTAVTNSCEINFHFNCLMRFWCFHVRFQLMTHNHVSIAYIRKFRQLNGKSRAQNIKSRRVMTRNRAQLWRGQQMIIFMLKSGNWSDVVEEFFHCLPSPHPKPSKICVNKIQNQIRLQVEVSADLFKFGPSKSSQQT